EHNRAVANSYRAGMIDSCVDNRQWTDTLQKIRTRLLNCLKVRNPILLLDIEREIALDIPTWAGDLYKRTPYAKQQLTAERRMAYAARKRRPLDEDFFAARQDKVDARKRAAREAREEADRILQAEAVTMLARLNTQDPCSLNLALQILRDMGPEKAGRLFLPRPMSPDD